MPAKKSATKSKSSARATITKVRNPNKGGKEHVTNLTFNLDNLPEHPARIRRALGITKNLGDFESGRIDVSLELPCDPKELEGAYAFAAEWVDNKMDEEIKRGFPG